MKEHKNTMNNKESVTLTLGDRIRAVRLAKELTLKDFGIEVGRNVNNNTTGNIIINKSTVSRWENNKTKPKEEYLEAIATLGGVSTDYLKRGSSMFNLSDYSLGTFDDITDEEEKRWTEVLLDNSTKIYVGTHKNDQEFKKEIRKLLNAQDKPSSNNPFSDLSINSKSVILTTLKLVNKINFANTGDTSTIQDRDGKILAVTANVQNKIKRGFASIHNNSHNAIAAELNDVLCSIIELLDNKKPEQEHEMEKHVTQKLQSFLNTTSIQKKILDHD